MRQKGYLHPKPYIRKMKNRIQITGNEGKGLFASDFGYEVLYPSDLVFWMQITPAPTFPDNF